MAVEVEEHVAVDIIAEERLVDSISKKLQAFLSEPDHIESSTIHRVPPSVRDQSKSDYDPKIISIGPFHGGKEALQAMEPLKWRYLNDLISRSPENNKLDEYIAAITYLEPQVRQRYSEKVQLDHDAFVEMMVVDSCFLVEFLVKWHLHATNNRIDTVRWTLPLVKNDLLLLENQIPFFVLQVLYSMSVIPQLEKPTTFLVLAAAYIAPNKLQSLLTASPHHLLHLCHLSFKPQADEPVAASSCILSLVTWTAQNAMRLASCLFFWFLSLFLSCRHRHLHLSKKEGNNSEAPRTTGRATELKEAGVKFRRKEAAGSFLEVTFRGGTMEIPKLSIHETTPSWFRNLLAFEQCCPAAGSYFTSYAALLNNLIDTPGDVAVLKKCGVVESKLGGDEEVAGLFNQLCKGAYLDYEKHYLVELFKAVKRYSQIDRHRWRARLVHDYFGNPWATVSLIAAIILLALTVVQTFFTIFPYYNPRN